MFGDTDQVPTATGTNDTPWYTQLFQSAAEAYGKYLTLEQQHELLQIQNQRAAEGKPPLDVSQYTPGINVGVAADTQRTLMWVAGGIGAVWLLTSLSKRR